MRRRHAHPTMLQDALAGMRVVAPSLAALFAGLVLLAMTPIVGAATNPPPPVVNALPMPAISTNYPEQYAITKIMNRTEPVAFGSWIWDETAAPLRGPVLITVDLKSETLAVFRGGHQIGITRMIYGDDEKPTPIGVFLITQKSERHRSNIFVDAPMPYMLRMTNDGISVHGTDKVQPIYATNGCIGVPNGFARRLFDVASLGDRIVVTKASNVRIGTIIPTA